MKKRIEKSLIEQNILALLKTMEELQLDAIYISSFDDYLSEYVPLSDCPRFFITGLTGSVAEAVLLKNGKVHLFVDGRYHDQADLETDQSLVVVEKCAYGVSNKEAVLEFIKEQKISKIGLDGFRTELSFEKQLKDECTVLSFHNNFFKNTFSLQQENKEIIVKQVSTTRVGESAKDKINKILEKGQGLFISKLDEIAWLTNLRGFELPFQATFRSCLFCTRDRIVVILPPESRFSLKEEITGMEIIGQDIKDALERLGEEENLTSLLYDPDTISSSHFDILINSFKSDLVKPLVKKINDFQKIKNKEEIKTIEDAFNKSNQVIADSLKWLEKKIKKNERVSELDFFEKVNANYKEANALDQSFFTIAAVAENSATVHFSSPSAEKIIKDGDMILLDSGALYEDGYATDTTRTIFVGKEEASKGQKEIYTLVLKGLLKSQNAIFKEGTLGQEIDLLARGPIEDAGHHYSHGTGHGVGINVHEAGYRLTPVSEVPLYSGLVGSIEPGIYLTGENGVRLENIVIVEKCEGQEGMLKFRNLVYIGFDYRLIDDALLNDEERLFLDFHEKECIKRGTGYNYNGEYRNV